MQDFKEGWRQHAGEGYLRDKDLSWETRESLRQRTECLTRFQTADKEASLAEVIQEKEHCAYPERAFWEAVEVMMMDEALRDRLLDQQSKEVKASEQDRLEYVRVISKYRSIVQLVDDELNPDYKTQEVIPFTKMGDMRIRLADLLANQIFYFPRQPVHEQDRREAFDELKKQFTRERREGIRAELALIGLLRYGAQWAWGGVTKSEQFLRPAIHIEHVLPREDVLVPEYNGEEPGQFNGSDMLFKLKKDRMPRPVQLKTGQVIDKPGFTNLAAAHLIEVFSNVLKAGFMTNEGLHEYSLIEQRRNYAAAMDDIIKSIGLDEVGESELRKVLIPPTERLAKKILLKDAPPTTVWSMTFKDLQVMLKENRRFREFATLHGVPKIVDASMFRYVSDLVRRLRAEYPQEDFWAEWPTTPAPKKKPKPDYEYVPRYARI